jgi:hypothetical protein
VHLIVAADVEQDDLLLRRLYPEDDAELIGDADGLDVLQFPAEMMIGKVRRKGVVLQVIDHLRKAFPQIGMPSQELARATKEALRRHNREHYASSSRSSACSSSSADAKRLTLPALRSSSEARRPAIRNRSNACQVGLPFGPEGLRTEGRRLHTQPTPVGFAVVAATCSRRCQNWMALPPKLRY